LRLPELAPNELAGRFLQGPLLTVDRNSGTPRAMCSKFRVCSRLLPDVVEVTRYRLFDDHAIVRNACLCAGFWTPGFGGADSHPPNILALPGAASGPSNSPAFKPALLTLSQPHPPVKTPPCGASSHSRITQACFNQEAILQRSRGCLATKECSPRDTRSRWFAISRFA
jgi:hypothetical protein